MEYNNRFNEIIQDELILAIFIFLNILNIYADEIEKNALINKDSNLLRSSKDLIIFTLIITFTIYVYFLFNNYKDMVDNQNSDDSYVFMVRYIGSLLIVIGLGCFLYFRFKTRGNDDINLNEIF